jgi:hypothetical protein
MMNMFMVRDSITPRIGPGRSRTGIPTGVWDFFFETSRPALGLPSYLFRKYVSSFPGIRRPRWEFDHSFTSTTKVRMSGGIPPLSLYAFMLCAGTILPLYCISITTDATLKAPTVCKSSFRWSRPLKRCQMECTYATE